MWKSFSKGLEKNWKAATKGISTAADKNFDKVSHGTYDKSDHWHSEYRDDGFMYRPVLAPSPSDTIFIVHLHFIH